MNKGDKLICIKDIYQIGTDKINFIAGKEYEIIFVGEISNNGNTYEELEITNENGKQAWISFKQGTWCYADEFITLAEWRDYQIDKILEDE
jgi:hypothetical protein